MFSKRGLYYATTKTATAATAAPKFVIPSWIKGFEFELGKLKKLNLKLNSEI